MPQQERVFIELINFIFTGKVLEVISLAKREKYLLTFEMVFVSWSDGRIISNTEGTLHKCLQKTFVLSFLKLHMLKLVEGNQQVNK